MTKTKLNKTNFTLMLGNSPRLRILDFLISNDRTSWNLRQIMINAHVNYDVMKRELNSLVKLGLIILDRKEIAKQYMLDKNNKTVKIIISIYNECNKLFVEKEE